MSGGAVKYPCAPAWLEVVDYGTYDLESHHSRIPEFIMLTLVRSMAEVKNVVTRDVKILPRVEDSVVLMAVDHDVK